MNKTYIVGLSLVAVFTLASQIFIQLFLNKQEDDAKIINIAGRQRMLSQQIVKNIFLIKEANSSNDFSERQKELAKIKKLWIKSHKGLQNGDVQLSLPQIKQSVEIYKLYQKITPSYQKIQDIISKVISLDFRNKKNIERKIIQEILTQEKVFLKIMNEIVLQYEKEAKARVQNLRTLESVLMLFTILILFLVGVFIFRPLMKKVNKNIEKVESDKKDLESELLSEVKRRNTELEFQQEKVNAINEKLLVNQAILKKSRQKLKESLEKNALYLEQIEEQKEKLEESNQKLQNNQEILKKSHFKLKKSLEKNITYVNEIETQKKELQEKNAELLSIEEELRQSNEFLEETVHKRTLILEQQSKNMEQLYRNLSASISYAQQIQEAILPKISQIQTSFTDSFIFFRPLDIVSGDFYFYTETSYKKVVAAVDSTGHGIPGAFMSLIGNDLLYEIVKIKGISSPNQILLMLKEEIVRVLRQDETGNRDGMDLAICVIDSYPEELKEDLGVPTLQYAGARNPLVIIQDKEMQVIKGDKITIGGIEKEFENKTFTNHIIPLYISTTFYIFSDGIQDQFGGVKNKKFSSKRLYNLLYQIYEETMDKQKNILEEAINKWQNESNQEQIDDMLMVGVRI